MAGQIDGTHHLRASSRYKLFHPTEITLEGQTARAHILNLSAGGALVFAIELPAKGVLIGLRCDDQVLRARVAWNGQDRFGVAFVSPLLDADVSRVVADQDAAVRARADRRPTQA